MTDRAPKHLDLDKQRGLTIEWADGTSSFYTIEHLRAMSPSADQREARADSQRNPLHVITKPRADDKPLIALNAELVGNYALRIRFSDGHRTGIYSWDYLREIDPGKTS